MSKEIGDIGEDLACRILQDAGYEILERNYRARVGEIDVITKKEDSYIFVEVKYRKDEGFGEASEFVTKNKLQKILKTAKKYLYENRLLEVNWRIDVVAINAATKEHEIIQNVYIEGISA